MDISKLKTSWYKPEDTAEAERIVLAILTVAGGVYNGAIRLNKVFYDAHLFYFNKYGKTLTSHPIARMPKGPAMDHWKDIREKLVRDGKIKYTINSFGPYKEDVYVLCANQIEMAQEEREAIQNALNWVGKKTAEQISEESHERSVTWRSSTDGKLLHVYLDTLTEDQLMQSEEIFDSIKF